MSSVNWQQNMDELESKLAFQEQSIEMLNQTVIHHELEISKLREQLRMIADKLKAAAPSLIATQSEETPPPHY